MDYFTPQKPSIALHCRLRVDGIPASAQGLAF